MTSEKCGRCDGSGFIDQYCHCPDCRGSGSFDPEAHIEMSIDNLSNNTSPFRFDLSDALYLIFLIISCVLAYSFSTDPNGFIQFFVNLVN